MSNYWGKAPSSRPIKSHSLAYTGSGTNPYLDVLRFADQPNPRRDASNRVFLGSRNHVGNAAVLVFGERRPATGANISQRQRCW